MENKIRRRAHPKREELPKLKHSDDKLFDLSASDIMNRLKIKNSDQKDLVKFLHRRKSGEINK